jgi:DNA-binding IclR family transcriptional regulator
VNTAAHNDRRTLAAFNAVVNRGDAPTVTAVSQHSGLTARQTLNALDRLAAAGVVRFGRDGWVRA